MVIEITLRGMRVAGKDKTDKIKRESSRLKGFSGQRSNRCRSQLANFLSSFGTCGIIGSRCLMIDHEKFQKGRALALGVAAVVVALVAIWKFAIR
jgi:hypothetical protein